MIDRVYSRVYIAFLFSLLSFDFWKGMDFVREWILEGNVFCKGMCFVSKGNGSRKRKIVSLSIRVYLYLSKYIKSIGKIAGKYLLFTQTHLGYKNSISYWRDSSLGVDLLFGDGSILIKDLLLLIVW